jgi:hypothetical protein
MHEPVSKGCSRRNAERRPRWAVGLAFSLLVVGLAVAVSCRPDPASQRGVAERFLDAHYVQIDLAAAQALTAGVAERKVAEERRLTAGYDIDAATRQPSVHYRLLEERPEGEDRSRFVYRARFSVPGGGRFERRILLVMRREEGGWKVVNFEEFE